MKIAMIVPNLPPTVCGVYDYTRKLAEHWPSSEAWTLLCPQKGTPWPEADAAKIERKAAALTQALLDRAPDAVGLQYTCYGYAEDGVPTWLAEGLEAFRAKSRANIAVMFHELFYDGPLWRRARWRKPRQQALAKRLCLLSNTALSGMPEWNLDLEKLSGRAAQFAPIPSNIEPVAFARHSGPLSVGIFGLAHSRERALRAHRKLLLALKPDKLHLIGDGLANGLTTRESKLVAGLTTDLSLHSNPDAAKISAAIANCHVMLSPCGAHEIWKSGSSMAALAHGCALIATGTSKLGGPPLFAYEGKGPMENLLSQLAGGEARLCGEAARKWYESHSGWPRAVAVWKKALS